ncbi:hypothetical protein HMI56_000869 [Coelomomyces lativittatus]|nr:hypothetical protein HMI56_000869 [Coelomomyces lativittatus]
MLKSLLPTPYRLHHRPYFIIKNIDDYFKLGHELYKFEKTLEANFIKFASNSEKWDTIPNQSNEKVPENEGNFWKCNKRMTDLVDKMNDNFTNLLCLLMAYKLKMSLAKTHPGIAKLLLQEGNSESLDVYDEERIFIIQNSESNFNFF